MDRLTLTFEVPERADGKPSGVVALGRRQFRLYVEDDQIPLPDIVLGRAEGVPGYITAFLPPQIRAQDEDGRDLPPSLMQTLEAVWVPPGSVRHVTVEGRRLLTEPGVRIPAATVHGTPEAPRAGRPPQIDLTFTLDYEDTSGRRPMTASFVLEFAPRGETPGRASAVEDDEYLRLRPPHTGPDYLRFAVVDFGTTASTVTMVDPSEPTTPPVDKDQGAELSTMLTVLLAPPTNCPPAWAEAVAKLKASEVLLPGQDRQRITGAEAVDRAVHEPDVRDALLLRVERMRREAGPALRAWLTPKMHAGYLAAVNQPAITRHYMLPIQFPTSEAGWTYAQPSALHEGRNATHSQKQSVHDGRAFMLSDDNANSIFGVKRQLLQFKPPPVPGSDVPAIHLAQHMYHLLVDQAESDIAVRHEKGDFQVQTVVATYPTTVLPEARERLERLIGKGLSVPQVVMSYDEGLAAGMFFVMRDLSGNQNLGLEWLRSSSRLVRRDPSLWERIMLVVDIGGGTTDIALLKLELTDETVGLSAEERFVSGRDYMLRPHLLGSTGHGQLGGDLLTLLVFYWIKARLIDDLRPGGPVSPTLAELVVSQADAHLHSVVSDEVRKTLDQLLPTQTERAPGGNRILRTNRFQVLWSLAEKVKVTLGQADSPRDEPYTISRDEVGNILDVDDHGLRSPSEVKLDPDQFARLIRPVTRRAADIAAQMVITYFKRHTAVGTDSSRPRPVLDRVVLSGRSSALAEVRAAITAALTSEPETAALLGWSASALSVETGHLAKQATSIGAAWVHHTGNVTSILRDLRGDPTKPDRRHSEITVDTRGLFGSLPCDFEVGAQGGLQPRVLHAGQPFMELDVDGRPGVRSDRWSELPRQVALNRPVLGDRPIQWGSFDLWRAARAEQIQVDGGNLGLYYRIEVDDRLYPFILLCHGNHPRLLVRGHALSLADRPGFVFDARAGACTLPGRLCYAVGEDVSGPVLAELFPQTSPQNTAYMTEIFHDSNDSEEPGVAGRVATVGGRLERGSFGVYLDRGDGRPEPLGRLDVPGGGARPGLVDRFQVTLDARGQLRVHRGEVPFLAASSLAMALRRPGRVLTRRMDPGDNDFNNAWNPYTGRH